MKINEATLIKIEKYLTNEMNPHEIEIFEKEINNSIELKEFIELYQQIDDFEDEEKWALYEGDSEKLKATSKLFLSKDVQEFSEKIGAFRMNAPSFNKTKNNSWLRIAIGSGLTICIALFLIFTFFQSNSLINLYQDNNSWEELPSLTVKGDVEEFEKAKIESLFSEKKYKETIVLCNKVIESSESIQPNLLLYLGVSQIELEQYQEALYSFTKLERSNAIDFHKAYWYKSLVFLKQENKEKAILELQKIEANDTYFNHYKAKKILKKLK